mgnify:CR=1 FL=1
MEQKNNEIVNTYVKREPFMRLFFERKCIWENKDCYKFLTKRQYQIALLILKNLNEFERCSQKKLLGKTRDDFRKYIDEKLIEYGGLPSKILSSEKDKWIIRKTKDVDKYTAKVPFFASALTTLNYMISFFIYRKQIWDTTKKRPGAYILCLNKRGRKIVEEILKREEESKKQIVEQVITQQ